MNTERTTEDRISRWLLETAPGELPDRVLDSTFDTTRSMSQVSGVRPWRNLSMRPLPILFATGAVAIALIAFVAFGGFGFAPGPGGPGSVPTASPSPTAVPTASPSAGAVASAPITWTPYTSDRFAYTIDYPSDWLVTPATMDWPSTDFPEKSGPSLDIFGPRSFGTQLFVSSVALKPGKTPADWLAELDRWNTNHQCHLSTPGTITVDGVGARQQEGDCMGGDQIVEVVMANKDRFYQINLFGAPTGSFTDEARARLDRFLASFHFGA